MFLVDSHCHLDGLDYQSLHKDVDDVLAKAAARDVKFCFSGGDDAAGVSPYAQAGGQAR
ncbi:putative metallodependent hydrolase [Salmonella enterica subsp. enterica]|uniref:Putative metallodependent hydrolase n=1 Tax=Salmonella enterica I TaxID=59201 RepID=A0A3S4HX98_SALET|nr:putative metallodependent hydrolase [Salmonella enterica subsp. enterica]